MTKYSEEVVTKSVLAVEWTDAISSATNVVTAVFDTLERAPWWGEVEEGYTLREGEPIRREFGDHSYEGVFKSSVKLAMKPHAVFRDTRWTPPVPPVLPLAVGDVIETVEDLERMPLNAGFVDRDGSLWQVEDNECRETIGASMAGGDWEGFPDVIFYAPLTVCWLPETERVSEK